MVGWDRACINVKFLIACSYGAANISCSLFRSWDLNLICVIFVLMIRKKCLSSVSYTTPLLQEKQKMKVKEKLEKCMKEKLLELCDILDIPVAKATSKKVCSCITTAC